MKISNLRKEERGNKVILIADVEATKFESKNLGGGDNQTISTHT